MKKIILIIMFIPIICTAEFLGSDGRIVSLKYRYASPASEFENTPNTHNFNANLLNKNNAILHGPGVTYGLGSSSFIIEGVYNMFVAFSEVESKAFVIPYFGMQLGIGYHEFEDENGKKYHEFEPEDNDFNDIQQILHNFIVTRFMGGIKYPVNNDVAIDIFFSKNFTMDKAFESGTGISLKF